MRAPEDSTIEPGRAADAHSSRLLIWPQLSAQELNQISAIAQTFGLVHEVFDGVLHDAPVIGPICINGVLTVEHTGYLTPAHAKFKAIEHDQSIPQDLGPLAPERGLLVEVIAIDFKSLALDFQFLLIGIHVGNRELHAYLLHAEKREPRAAHLRNTAVSPQKEDLPPLPVGQMRDPAMRDRAIPDPADFTF